MEKGSGRISNEEAFSRLADRIGSLVLREFIQIAQSHIDEGYSGALFRSSEDPPYVVAIRSDYVDFMLGGVKGILPRERAEAMLSMPDDQP